MSADFEGHLPISTLMDAFAWEKTPLGPKKEWSSTLNTSINICLRAQFPTMIIWGEEMIQVYNESYRNIIGVKHPAAFGNSARVVWKEVWNEIGGMLEGTLHRGESHLLENQPFAVNRFGVTQERFFTYSYSPIVDIAEKIVGIFVTAIDTTEAVLADVDEIAGRVTKSKRDADEAEIRLRMAIEATNIGTWEYNPVSGELNWSEECRKVYDFPHDANVDFETFSRHIHPDDFAYVQEEIAKSMSPEGPGNYDIKYRILRFRSLEVRWIRAQGRVFFNQQRIAERFIGTVVDITEQRNVEETLKENELKARLAIEAAGIGTFLWDVPREQFQHSARLAEMFGYKSASKLTHKDFANRIHPEDQDLRLRAHQTAFETGQLFYEARIVWPDETIHWYRFHGTVFYENGKVSRLYGTALDITAQKSEAVELENKIQERTRSLQLRNLELKRSEEKYHRVVAEVQDYAIILLNTEGLIQNWNKGAEKIKRYAEKEVLGKHISIFYTPEDQKRKLPQQLLNEATTTGRAGHEGWRVRKDGTLFWGSVTITALHDDKGYIIGYSKVTRDLTERKQAEEELKRKHEALKISEQRYHLMVSEVQDYAIILLDKNGIILNWNKGAQHIKQYREGEVVGKHFRLFYLAEDRQSKLPERLIMEAAQRGKATHEGWRQRKDGTHFWGSIVITALHDESGELIGFSKVTRDLTERKNSEDQIFLYTQKLELQNRELEQFAYVASHDLQEPLRKIQTFADLVQKNIDNRPLVVKYLDKIDVSSARMSQLVTSLLGYSRLSALEGDKVDVDLNAVLAQVETDFELLIAEKKATITSNKLPTIKGHAMQLSQLFGNLIGNALKFNYGVPVISITYRLISKDEAYNAENLIHPKYIELAFKDNGIGFEQKYAAKIFTIFQRLHDRMTFQGTGIGLALCKKIMENHDGAISCYSEPEKGATFYAYFPIEQ